MTRVSVTSQFEVGHDLAVGVPQEPEIGNSEHCGGTGLLLLADASPIFERLREVGTPGVTAGHQAVDHLHPGGGPRGDRSGAAEVDVIGMGADHQRSRHFREVVHRQTVPGESDPDFTGGHPSTG